MEAECAKKKTQIKGSLLHVVTILRRSPNLMTLQRMAPLQGHSLQYSTEATCAQHIVLLKYTYRINAPAQTHSQLRTLGLLPSARQGDEYPQPILKMCTVRGTPEMTELRSECETLLPQMVAQHPCRNVAFLSAQHKR